MRRALAQDSGFTIVELLIAGLILVVGVCGTLTLVVGANESVVAAKHREGGTNLAREILEQTRRFSFSSIDDATLDAKLQALPGLANVGSPGYQVERRGVRYTIDTAVCAIDDAGDGYGAAGSGRCSATPAGTEDGDPVDFKQVTVTATTSAGGRQRTVRQTAVIGSRGGAEVPVLSDLRVTSPVGLDPNTPTISDPAVSIASLRVTATEGTEKVVLSVDGTDVGDATRIAGTNDWTYDLNITAIPDGPRAIGARGENASHVAGPTTSMTLTLIRGPASPPRDVAGGPNNVYQGGVLKQATEVEWLPSPSPNVIGYRTYRPNGTLACPSSMSTLDLALACIDFSPVAGRYEVASVYRKADGTFGESTRGITGTVDPGLRTFYSRNTQGNTGTGCTAPAVGDRRDLVEGYGGTATSWAQTGADNATLRFCSPQGGLTLDGGAGKQARIYVYGRFTGNSNAAVCTVTVALHAGTTSYGSQNVTFRRSDSSRERVVTLNIPSTRVLTSSERLMVSLTAGASNCDRTTFYYGGTSDGGTIGQRARVEVPSTFWQPPAPTGLTAARQPDDSVNLTWTQPTGGGGTLRFFRIYRDGFDVDKRYDRTGDALTGYVDPNRDGGTHSYYVTAVSDDLGESLVAGPVTG